MASRKSILRSCNLAFTNPNTSRAASSEAAALADEIAGLYEEWGQVTEALGTTAG